MIDEWLAAAIDDGVSDIFVAEGEALRVRKDDKVVVWREGKAVPDREQVADLWRECAFDPEVTRDGDGRYMRANGQVLRMNVYRASGRLCAALRPVRTEIPQMEWLELPAETLRKWTTRESGLILVTGPTGSGKSTTLAAMLDDLAQRTEQHIVTIEDPIEYIFTDHRSYFSQREVGLDTESYPQAMRAALRQNPDVILIGEIRDYETAKIALQAAETGHLVLATLHSASVTKSFTRLAYLFPEGERHAATELLSRQVVGVLSQMLLPEEGGGIQLVHERLTNQGGVREWIAGQRMHELEDYLLRSEDDQSMLESLVAAVHAGQVDADVARGAARNPGDFERMLSGIF